MWTGASPHVNCVTYHVKGNFNLSPDILSNSSQASGAHGEWKSIGGEARRNENVMVDKFRMTLASIQAQLKGMKLMKVHNDRTYAGRT